MNKNEFSSKSLKTGFKSGSAGVYAGDVNGTHGSLTPQKHPLVKMLNGSERKKTLDQLGLLISRFNSTSLSNPDEFKSFRMEELPNILRLLVELITETNGNKKNRQQEDRKKLQLKRKLKRVSADMLSRMLHTPDASYYEKVMNALWEDDPGHTLHTPDASYYRILGLNNGATSEQIEEHYQLLHVLFWSDEEINPHQESRLLISYAYKILKNPDIKVQHNDKNQIKLKESVQDTSKDKSHDRSNLLRIAAVALLAVIGLTGAMFSFDRIPNTDIIASSEKIILPQSENDPVTNMAVADEISAVSQIESPLQDTLPEIVEDEIYLQSGITESDIQASVSEPKQTDSLPAPDQKMVSAEMPQDSVAPVNVSSEIDPPPPVYSSLKDQTKQATLTVVSTHDNSMASVPPKEESSRLTDSGLKDQTKQEALAIVSTHHESVVSTPPKDELSQLEDSSLKSKIEQAAIPAVSMHDSSVVSAPPRTESPMLADSSLKEQIEHTALFATSTRDDSVVVSTPPKFKLSPLAGLSLKERIEQAALPSVSTRSNSSGQRNR